MKKVLLFGLIFCAVANTSVNAQAAQSAKPAQAERPAMDHAALLKQMKEKFKAPMVEKTGLTEAQVDKVIEINLDIRMRATAELEGLSDEDRSKKLADFKAEKEKRYAAIPLTADQVKSVYAFYEEFGKSQQKTR